MATKRLEFSTQISAPPSVVFARMIDPETYRDWTSAFAEGSYFEGSWETGQRITFRAPNGDGMIAEIAECRPNERISIRHLGQIINGVEDTESEAVRAWTPAYENYTFVPAAGGTKLVVDLDITEAWEKFMADTWPKALARLKALCEAAPRG